MGRRPIILKKEHDSNVATGLNGTAQTCHFGTESLPVFAPVAIHLLNVVSQENVGLAKLAALIRADAGITTEVLRLANSPLFGARHEITGILHALAMLGLNRIKSMVMTVAIRDFLAPARSAVVFAPCWRHCLATAFLSEEMAGYGDYDRDGCYTAGLIHELGRLALIAACPAKYDEAAAISTQEDRDMAELEREFFGTDHNALRVQLMLHWNLPRFFREVLEPHTPRTGAAELVHTACEMANMMGFRVGGPECPWDLSRLAGLPAAMVPESPAAIEELTASVATKINTLECSLVMV